MKIFNCLLIVLVLASCAESNKALSPTSSTINTQLKQYPDSRTQGTVASFYHDGLEGKETASGEAYDPGAFTAAHRSLPFGTRVQFFNPKNDANVTVRINDRGPKTKGRDFDLSFAAAEELGIIDSGVAVLEYRILSAQ